MFVFRAGQAKATPSSTSSAMAGRQANSLRFVGFGMTTGGATFTQIGASNQWQIHSGLDAHNEIITFLSGATIHSTDYLFV